MLKTFLCLAMLFAACSLPAREVRPAAKKAKAPRARTEKAAVKLPAAVAAPDRDFGIAVPAGTSRGAYAVKDGKGRDVLVILLMDDANRRVLQIDAETGHCDIIPVPNKSPDAVYSSILASNGRIYSVFGNQFNEYSPAEKKFTYKHRTIDLASMGLLHEAPDGTIWGICYPNADVFSYQPRGQVFTDYGRVNKENWRQYPRTIVAAPDGWVYAGIGNTTAQCVALHPATRKSHVLFTKDRPARFSPLVSLHKDGTVSCQFGKQWYTFRDGKATAVAAKPKSPVVANPRTGSQGLVYTQFPSGRQLLNLDTAAGTFTVRDKNGQTRSVKFSYPNVGAPVMDLAVNSDGLVACGGGFPFFFGTLDPRTGRTDRWFCDVQCNALRALGKDFYICGYTGGILIKFDPSKPWNVPPILRNRINKTKPGQNPVVYGNCRPDLLRPHDLTFTPDGKFYLAGGTPAYGATGGGIVLLELASGKYEVVPHTRLAKDESPESLAVLDNRRLLVGTTIHAGSGGEIKATSASLLIFDLAARKTLWISRALGKFDSVIGLEAVSPSRALALTNDKRLVLFDVDTQKAVAQQDLSAAGDFPRGQGSKVLVRHQGRFYLVFRHGFALVNPDTCQITRLWKTKASVQCGGAFHQDRTYYIGDDRHWHEAILK